MALERQALAWDRHTNVAELNLVNGIPVLRSGIILGFNNNSSKIKCIIFNKLNIS